MSPWGEVLVGLVILASLLGIVIPVLPGLALLVAATLAWALFESTPIGWVTFTAVLGLGATATVIKYLVPGRRLKESGVSTSTLVIAVFSAIVGFFAIPVLGAPIGFVAGIYFIEWSQSGHAQAWPKTRKSASAVALSIGLELSAGLLMAAIWLAAAIFG